MSGRGSNRTRDGVRPRVAVVDPGAFTPAYDHALCRALAASGAEVELVTSPFVYGEVPRPEGYARCEPFPGASTAVRGGRTLARLRRLVAWPVAWRRLLATWSEHPPDVVHLQWAPVPPIERRALAALAGRGIPAVVTVHNVAPHGDEPFRRARLGPLLAEAAAIVVHSRFAETSLAAAHPKLAERVHRIAPGASPPRSAVARETARAALGLPADGPLVLLAGLVRAYKGIDVLLAAFERVAELVPAARLAIVGRAGEGGTSLAAAVASKRAAARIHVEDAWLDDARFEQALLAADVVALPYHGAAESAVLLAAMAAARPVVATRTGALAETLGGGVAPDALVPPGDAAALAGALARFVSDAELRAREGERNAAEAARRFSWADCAARTLALYDSLPDLPARSGSRLEPSLA